MTPMTTTALILGLRWRLDLKWIREFVRSHESTPTSRYWFGSPCRFVRTLDLLVHVVLPEMLTDHHPQIACYLRSTSPRWGKAWRGWKSV